LRAGESPVPADHLGGCGVVVVAAIRGGARRIGFGALQRSEQDGSGRLEDVARLGHLVRIARQVALGQADPRFHQVGRGAQSASASDSDGTALT